MSSLFGYTGLGLSRAFLYNRGLDQILWTFKRYILSCRELTKIVFGRIRVFFLTASKYTTKRKMEFRLFALRTTIRLTIIQTRTFHRYLGLARLCSSFVWYHTFVDSLILCLHWRDLQRAMFPVRGHLQTLAILNGLFVLKPANLQWLTSCCDYLELCRGALQDTNVLAFLDKFGCHLGETADVWKTKSAVSLMRRNKWASWTTKLELWV